jgi:hypothetical protein
MKTITVPLRNKLNTSSRYATLHLEIVSQLAENSLTSHQEVAVSPAKPRTFATHNRTQRKHQETAVIRQPSGPTTKRALQGSQGRDEGDVRGGGR